MKNTIIAVVATIIVIVGGYFLFKTLSNTPSSTGQTGTPAQTVNEPAAVNANETVIGTSVQGRTITAYHFGTGDTELLFIGGIHGGYEWNTSLVAYEAMDYLKANPDVIPSNLKVTVIPVLNPDGLFKVAGTEGRFTASDISSSQTVQTSGRFNGNTVDLNRNFDCDWIAEGKWQNTNVSGGTEAFSEPESQAIKSYIESNKPVAVVTWFSAAGGVYASNCHNGVSKETNAIMKTFADASGYPAYASFDFYAITGDMTNWLAKIGTPAISILLTNHTDTEWTKNLAGIKALLNYYSK